MLPKWFIVFDLDLTRFRARPLMAVPCDAIHGKSNPSNWGFAKKAALPAPSINPNLLQQHDCVIGILRLTEKNRVSPVAKVGSANRIEPAF